MTALARRLADVIRAHGPISIERFMALALDAYYGRRDPLGVAGDFTTAPEISQIFGELVGLWCAERWLAAGKPAPVRWIELGPGRGTLMADALRAGATVPGLSDAVRVHLVERSPALRRTQRRRLPHAQWHDGLADVPAGFGLIVANEFFDALPIRQLVHTDAGWRERGIGLSGDAFVPVALQAGPDLAALVPPCLRAAPIGSIFERHEQAESMITAIAARLAAAGGWALIFDYGHGQARLGETLQALRRHDYAPVFADPGKADLSAHVDFAALVHAAAAAGAGVWGPVGQGVFLERLGIGARAQR
ncbi:MAG: class I SAM-dependent methyltransferase, partial [Alphaproteobacteria bacterium]